MFDYKKINFKLFGLTIFTVISFYNTQQVVARRTQTNKKQNYLFDFTVVNTIEPSIIERNINRSYDGLSLRRQQNPKKENELLDDFIASEDLRLPIFLSSIEHKSILISQKTEDSDNIVEKSKTSKNKILTIYFLVLLFAPLVIFYPFFLFYKKLLNVDKNKDEMSNDSVASIQSSELKSLASSNPNSLRGKQSTAKTKAVVSKLQIAYAVRDENLKRQLRELCSSVDSRTDLGISELMRKTISLLIDRTELTHVCNSSESLTIDRVKTEFEAICVREKSKFVSEKPSESEDSENLQSADSPNSDSASYVVVTLVLCTSHSKPLFEEIHTKNQLLEELSKLGKMPQGDLIKFDLLWNPPLENQYLSNNELLKNYLDMVRLF